MQRMSGSSRRALVLALLTAGSGALAGCMSKPIRAVNADGTWCYRVGNSLRYRRTCTSVVVPAAEVEAQAKSFEAQADVLTVYVVRRRWGDAANLLRLVIDRELSGEIVPESFVRVRLRPGSHELRAEGADGRASLQIDGAAGQVRFIELVGSVWPWGSSYAFREGEVAETRKRILQVRMVADLVA
jgi:hypothetical protein